MSPFKIFLKLNLQYITDFENSKNQKGHVISDPFLSKREVSAQKGHFFFVDFLGQGVPEKEILQCPADN